LLLEGLRQFARALDHPLFEGRVGFLELPGHVVEALGERFHLLTGLHLDAMSQLTRADLGCALFESAARLDHAAGQEEAGAHGEHHAEEDEEPGARDRRAQWLKGFLERLLDEDAPPKRGDGGVGGENAAVPEIARDGHRARRRVPGVGRGQRGPHLVELAQIGLLEHEADVRMGDQRPLAIHHEGSPGLSDLDLGDDVPNELEVDLGDRHAPATDGKRDGHVGLGFFAKKDGAVIDTTGPRHREAGVLGVVGLASHHLHS
jgi:hypothetical protein